jgi:glutathione synthase/RimK-type ligase-like ATP-grasp enzyme
MNFGRSQPRSQPIVRVACLGGRNSRFCLHGLAFAGIDLKITPAGEIFCFEVNPSPDFSFYEANTGQPIASALARYLARF